MSRFGWGGGVEGVFAVVTGCDGGRGGGVLENVTSQAKLLEGIREDNSWVANYSHFAEPL
jgi:hypothetical protein